MPSGVNSVRPQKLYEGVMINEELMGFNYLILEQIQQNYLVGL